uniref:Uncharacterized protein n=1 Tax=Anguilla anguilla TaxID=7936 RepID=A0A0E9PT11_ANGAN
MHTTHFSHPTLHLTSVYNIVLFMPNLAQHLFQPIKLENH